MDRISHSMTHQSRVKSRRPSTNYTERNNVLSSINAHTRPCILYVNRGLLPQRPTDYSVGLQPKLARMLQTK